MGRSSNDGMLHIPLTFLWASQTSFLKPKVVIADKWQGEEFPEGYIKPSSLIIGPDEVVECLVDINLSYG